MRESEAQKLNFMLIFSLVLIFWFSYLLILCVGLMGFFVYVTWV
ncbi:hypothetical protein HanXRQr2_Chr03g0134121 [Helianthus annuus]|uniref:Uncharacterized protein n=1 Tax=Helianthus annuus TaxID=4232 RepID=A0A9K3JJE7_HELAN|nr:hypothetical protein HanXRQr2_Chr03g0134121 [Helianthus annuus]